FRLDLYYRLRGISLTLPPLRERPGDLALLAKAFLKEIGGNRSLSAAAFEALGRYRWPGNVRELRSVIHAAALIARGPVIEATDLPADLLRPSPSHGEISG